MSVVDIVSNAFQKYWFNSMIIFVNKKLDYSNKGPFKYKDKKNRYKDRDKIIWEIQSIKGLDLALTQFKQILLINKDNQFV